MFFCPAKLFQGIGMRLSASGIRCVHFKKPERIAEKVARKVQSGLWSWLLTTIAEPRRMYFFKKCCNQLRVFWCIPAAAAGL
jgi:nitric oxide synthase oxygenase domain/subunit